MFDLKLFRGVETIKLGCTEINPSLEIKSAGDNVLYGNVQGILLVLVRNTDDVCRKVKLPVELVSRMKRSLFSNVVAAQKRVKTVITKGGPLVDLGSFSIQLNRSDKLDHLDLAIVNESKRAESKTLRCFGENV